MTVVAQVATVSSPNGRLKVNVNMKEGRPYYSVLYNGKQMLDDSPLGIIANLGDFSQQLTFASAKEEKISNDYTLNRNYLESFQLYSYNPGTDLALQVTSLGIGENNYNKSHSIGYNLTVRPQITYEHDFGRHHLSAIAFMERYTQHGDTMTGYKTGFADGPIDINTGFSYPAIPVSGGYSNRGFFGSRPFSTNSSPAGMRNCTRTLSVGAGRSKI